MAVDVKVSPEAKGINFHIVLLNYPQEQILNAFSKGYRSEITFVIKIYKVNTGFFSFFGDPIVTEHNIERIAGWDQFAKKYFFINRRGEKKIFSSEQLFFEALFAVVNYRLVFPTGKPKNLYALIGAEIEPVHLIPPLTIINLLNRKYIVHSAWEKVPL